MEPQPGDFQPAQYSDRPLYNIRAASVASGVSELTLRSWERRYGLPRPHRDAKGYRLYSARDVALIRWLRDRVNDGMGISRAVALLPYATDERPDVPPPPVPELPRLAATLFDAIVRFDESAGNAAITRALSLAPVEEVSVQVLQPALYRIGDMWARGELTVTSERFGSNLIRSHLSQLARLNPPARRDGMVLVGCAPSELHDIGALMLALFLGRRAFAVTYAGANLELESLIADVRRLKPSAVCLSAATVEAAHHLSYALGALRPGYTGLLAFGGRVFVENPHLVEGIGGLYLGSDLVVAVSRIEDALRRKRADPVP